MAHPPQSHTSPWAPSSALSPHHSLEWLLHKCWNSRTSQDPQHWSHPIEVPLLMGKTCLQNGGPSFTKDCLYGELSTSHRERSTVETLQWLSQRVPHCPLSCWPSMLVRHGSGPWCLASFNQQNGQRVWRRQKKCTIRQEKLKESLSRVERPTVSYFHQWTLLTALPSLIGLVRREGDNVDRLHNLRLWRQTIIYCHYLT